MNIKSYLLNGRSDVNRLTQAIKEMCGEQWLQTKQLAANQQVKVRHEYLNRSYLGNLPMQQPYCITAIWHTLPP